MTPIVLCRLAAVPDDQGLRVNIAGYPPLAVFRLDGQAHVTDDTCTHGEASLCEGEIEDGAVVCPYHLGAFDIRTGRPVAAPCSIALRVYPVRVVDGQVVLDPPATG
jgi:nitrite reductase/ring-hydroxylating ferredoxin subunit